MAAQRDAQGKGAAGIGLRAPQERLRAIAGIQGPVLAVAGDGDAARFAVVHPLQLAAVLAAQAPAVARVPGIGRGLRGRAGWARPWRASTAALASASASAPAGRGTGSRVSRWRSIRPVSRSAAAKALSRIRRDRKATLVCTPTACVCASACSMRARAWSRSAPRTISLAIMGS